MALYTLFENKNTLLFLYFIWLLLNLQMCQIILPDRVEFIQRNSYVPTPKFRPISKPRRIPRKIPDSRLDYRFWYFK